MRSADGIGNEIATWVSEQNLAERSTRDIQMKATGRGEAIALLTDAVCRLCKADFQRQRCVVPVHGASGAPDFDFVFWRHGESRCEATDLWEAIEKAGWV